MQLQHRILQHSTVAFPPRLYAHAPLSERGRYVTGSRHVCRVNDGGGDCSTHDDGRVMAQVDLTGKRRRASDVDRQHADEPHSRGIITGIQSQTAVYSCRSI